MIELRAYLGLVKMRLTTTVVLSAVFGYFIGLESFDWSTFLSLVLGGFLVVSSSNTFNQIFEIKQDAQMKRTKKRPVVNKDLSTKQALLFGALSGIIGILILYIFVHPLSAYLGILSLISYAFMYTPLKGISSFSVFVGAFPGAFPPLIGWVAATHHLGFQGFLIFGIQFLWQFPHFWSIAWLLKDDYEKANYKLLPSENLASVSQLIYWYLIMLLMASVLPTFFLMAGKIYLIFAILMSFALIYFAGRLGKNQDNKSAKQLMIATILYNPLLYLFLIIDKI